MCVVCCAVLSFRAAIDAIGKRLARASFAFRCIRRLERVVGRESAYVCFRRVCGSTTGKFRAASVGALGVFFVEIARRCRYLVSVVCRGSCVRFVRVRVVLGYLVDPASSHMLVSKIKPCMSKYKRLYCETANGSLNQLWFI